MNGKTVLQASGGTTQWAWWSPWYKELLGTGAGCTYIDQSRTLGCTVASDDQEVYTITMCPYSFAQPRRKDSLSAWRSKEKIIADNTPLRAAGSVPGTLMHEIAHLVTKHVVIDAALASGATAYYPTNAAKLALESKAKAVKNADTYAWLATSMYLDQCDWS